MILLYLLTLFFLMSYIYWEKYFTDQYDILSVFDWHTKKAIRIGEMDHGDRYYFVCRNKA